jgi:hypothetical protein
MHEIYELKDKLCKELEEYGAKDKMDVGTLDVVDKLAHTIKNLDKIIEKYEDDYSGDVYDDADRRHPMRGYSRARGRMNARRDSRGRYSSRMYSGDTSMIVQELKELKEDAPDEQTRMEFDKFIRKMESM